MKQGFLRFSIFTASLSAFLCWLLLTYTSVSGFWIFLSVALICLACIYLCTHFFITARLKKVLENIDPGQNKMPVPSDDIITDIDKHIKKVSAERKNELEQLKKLESYRKEFLGNVSHELKTPVFNIQGYISTLLDGGLHDPAINENYLQRAEKGVERMINIIDDLEAISRLETGELELEPERFDINPLISEALNSQEVMASGKGIILTFYHKPEEPLFVIADKGKIRQVLTNLIVNSITYGKDHGETKVRCYDTGKKILVEVADNGIGIPVNALPRLFERFYRVDKGRSREHGGTGLGLSIVKHIIEAHDEKINVLSTPGAGSVFSFTLQKA